MNFRFMVGLVLTATLSGCGSSGSGTGSVTAASASGTITSASYSSESAVTSIVLNGVPAGSVTAGSAYSFQPTVSYATGVVTFAVSGLPAWATFDSSTGTLSGTPSSAAAGTTGAITITATDGSSTGSVGPFVIRVNLTAPVTASAPPVISGSPASAITSGQTYAFQPAASDAAGNALSFGITNCPAWATFSTATGMLSGVPTAAQAGSYPNITITVSDGTLSASLPVFAIAVTAASPDMPVISGTPAASVVVGQAYAFTPAASDPAGKPLTFSIKNPPAWASFSTATGQLSGTPATTQSGAYAGIVISADNGAQMTSLPAFTIQVTPAAAPDAPTITGTAGATVAAGQAYSFTPTASDPAGKTLTFTIVNLPAWASFNATTGTLSGTPTTLQAGSYPGIGITVSNGSKSATLPTFSITVTRPPVTNGSATLHWTAPTTNVDGSPLTNLAGYTIYYGNSATSMTQSAQISDPATTSYVISGLTAGTWYFEIIAVNSADVDSPASAAVSKTI